MCEETDSLEQSGLITVHLSPESSFSFRLMVDLPLPSRLPHCQGCRLAAGGGSQGFRCPALCVHSLGPRDTRSHCWSFPCSTRGSLPAAPLVPRALQTQQAVVLANSLENGDVPELVLGPCPHLPEEAGFPDSAIVPAQPLKPGNQRDV